MPPTTPCSTPERAVAKRLRPRRLRLGDRIATLAWNTARHLECWYGSRASARSIIPSTRAFSDQIAWIMKHAEDRCRGRSTFVPLLEKLAR